MNEFQIYQKNLNQKNRHKIKKSSHILKREEYKDFVGFSEKEIWGDFCDFDYENWLKEQ